MYLLYPFLSSHPPNLIIARFFLVVDIAVIYSFSSLYSILTYEWTIAHPRTCQIHPIFVQLILQSWNLSVHKLLIFKKLIYHTFYMLLCYPYRLYIILNHCIIFHKVEIQWLFFNYSPWIVKIVWNLGSFNFIWRGFSIVGYFLKINYRNESTAFKAINVHMNFQELNFTLQISVCQWYCLTKIADINITWNFCKLLPF